MTHLFTELKLRDITLANRIGIPPMCQYSAHDGTASDWHFVHYGTRAVGGAGLIIVEATAVLPEGRISPGDLGLWDDRHAEPLKPITRFAREQGCTIAVQLAHAGRKAGVGLGWQPQRSLSAGEGGWTPERMLETGERIWNMERMFNMRAGFTGKDDNLPPRLLKEAAATGPAKGLVNGLAKMLPEYYQLRGWTADGTPTNETLSRLAV